MPLPLSVDVMDASHMFRAIIARYLLMLGGLLLVLVMLAILAGKIIASRELAYLSMSNLLQSHVRLLDAGHGVSIPLTDNRFTNITYRPIWAPDGSALIFPANDGTATQIYRLSPETRHLTQLTDFEANGEYEIIELALSPDGQHIAFVRSEGLDYQIYLMDSDGSNMRQITAPGGTIYTSLNWSYDSQRLTYTVSSETSTVPELWLLDVTDPPHATRMLIDQPGLGAILGRWSPVRHEITFIGIRAEQYESQPYLLLNVESGQIRQLFDDGYAIQTAVWSPDGHQLVYAITTTTNRSTLIDTIFLLDLASGESTRVTDLPENDHVFDIAWSPDGEILTLSLNVANSHSDIRALRLTNGQIMELGSRYIPESQRYDPIRLFPTWRP